MKRTERRNEQGMVSIMVTIILMMVISLIVISFARTSRREQRDSLDRQLSTNAFYAAESGINAAKKAIANDTTLLNNEYISSCTGSGSFAAKANLNGDVGSTNGNVKYTCLFVDPTVSAIIHGPTSEPYSFPIRKAASSDPAMGSVELYWDANVSANDATYTNCPAVGSNPQDWPSTTCSSGVLRLELTDSAHLDKSWVYFIYPGDNADKINFKSNNPAATGETHKAKCAKEDSPRQCHIQVTGLDRAVYARVSGIYKNYQLTVTPTGSGLEFEGAQVMIDSNGKAEDVQRRIQVRYNLTDLGGPPALIQAGASVCKKFSLDGTSVQDGPVPNCWNGATYPSPGKPTLP